MRAISELLDRAPSEVVAEAERIAQRTGGVISVGKVRSRRSGSRVFMDMAVTVAEGTEITKAHETASKVERAVKESLGDVDLVIHVEPAAHDELKKVITAAASKVPGVRNIHSVLVSEAGEGYNVRLHVGVDPKETVRGAHTIAEEVESRIREKDLSISAVVVHAEPLKPVAGYDLVEDVKSFLAGSTDLKVENVFVETVGEVTYVDIICVARGSARLADTHDLVTLLEDHVRELLGRDAYITVHMEPLRASNPA
jgi:divalent metal cation (Fe/Co/Zn/Cd) transporter